jgi:hypothetical protein
MCMSRLAVVLLSSVLLVAGSPAVLAERGQHTRSQLIQHDSRDRHVRPDVPHRRHWQDERRAEHPRAMRHEDRHQFERRDRGHYGRYYWSDNGAYRDQGGWSARDGRSLYERGYRVERGYPDQPGVRVIGIGRGYAPPRRESWEIRSPARYNPHPPGIYRPLHDGGLQRPSPY